MSHEGEAAHALGFRVKSGWATAVLLAGPVQRPQALERRVVELSDPAVPESKQPYHAAAGTLEEDAAKIRQRTKVIRTVTNRSVTQLLCDAQEAGYRVRGAGLVVGSQIDPAAISNPHIRAHALEGRLFRTALQEALQAQAVPCGVVVEREAYAKAATVLGQSEEHLKRAVAGLGHSLGGPWRAEEKLAALAAWIALA